MDRVKFVEWVQAQPDEKLHDLFQRGMLGNVAQSLGLSGKGTFQELLKAIRGATK